MDVADPMAEKLQRCELLRLARIVGRQGFEVLPDRRHDASRCARAALEEEPRRISWQVHEVLACSLARVIRPSAGLAEGAEAFVGADQFLDLGAGAGLDQANGHFTNDFVTLIAPGPNIAADWKEHQQQRHHQPMIHLAPASLGDNIFAQYDELGTYLVRLACCGLKRSGTGRIGLEGEYGRQAE